MLVGEDLCHMVNAAMMNIVRHQHLHRLQNILRESVQCTISCGATYIELLNGPSLTADGCFHLPVQKDHAMT